MGMNARTYVGPFALLEDETDVEELTDEALTLATTEGDPLPYTIAIPNRDGVGVFIDEDDSSLALLFSPDEVNGQKEKFRSLFREALSRLRSKTKVEVHYGLVRTWG